MRKSFSTLSALLAITSVAACGEPGVTNHAADSATEQAPLAVDKANDLPPVANEGASEPTPETNAEVRKEPEPKEPTVEAAFDPKNSSFVIDGRRVVLTNGLSQVAAAPGSASMITTRYFGKEVRGDLTKDGRDDLAYIITRDGGGSGQFYYVVVAINNPAGYKTTNAFLIGDRIEPQSLRITSDRLEVNFLGRERSEPMTSAPSRPSVLLLKVTPQGVLEGLMK